MLPLPQGPATGSVVRFRPPQRYRVNPLRLVGLSDREDVIAARTDNRITLDAMAQIGPTARGVAVVETAYVIMQRACPTAERTLDPARMLRESLNPGPELENNQDTERS